MLALLQEACNYHWPDSCSRRKFRYSEDAFLGRGCRQCRAPGRVHQEGQLGQSAGFAFQWQVQAKRILDVRTTVRLLNAYQAMYQKPHVKKQRVQAFQDAALGLLYTVGTILLQIRIVEDREFEVMNLMTEVTVSAVIRQGEYTSK